LAYFIESLELKLQTEAVTPRTAERIVEGFHTVSVPQDRKVEFAGSLWRSIEQGEPLAQRNRQLVLANMVVSKAVADGAWEGRREVLAEMLKGQYDTIPVEDKI